MGDGNVIVLGVIRHVAGDPAIDLAILAGAAALLHQTLELQQQPLGVVKLTLACGDPRLHVTPAQIPEQLLAFRLTGLRLPFLVADLIPFATAGDVAGFEQDAAQRSC